MRDRGLVREVAAAAAQKNKEKAYWLKKLSGELELTSFPYDYKKNITNSEKNKMRAETTFTFTGGHFKRLMKIGGQSDNRLYMVLVAGLVVLLGKYTGKKDIIVGTPIFKQEIEGNFINTILVLRNQIRENTTFKELVLAVRNTVREAVKNRNYPLEILARQLNISSFDHDSSLLFDVAVLLENIQDKKYLQPVNPGMVFSFWRGDGFIDGTIKYNPWLYNGETLQRLKGHFMSLVETLIYHVDTPLIHVEFLSEEEKNLLIYDLNNTARDYPRDKTIHELFEEQIERHPHHTALIGTGGLAPLYITYRELNKRSNQVANYLYFEKHLQPEDAVGVLMERSPLLLAALLGILKAGGVYVPLDRDDPEKRLKDIIDDSAAGIVISQKNQVKILNRLQWECAAFDTFLCLDTVDVYSEEEREKCGLMDEKLREYIGESATDDITENELTLFRYDALLRIDKKAGENKQGVNKHKHKYQDDAAALKKLNTRNPLLGVTSHHLAYVIYTSGTSGIPKGVMIEHGSVVRLVKNSRFVEWKAGDRLLPTGSTAFDISTFEMWGPLLNGVALVLEDKPVILNGKKLEQSLRRHKVTHLHLTPQLFEQLAVDRPAIFERLGYFLVGGDRVMPRCVNKIRKKYQGLKILHMYGPPENTTFSTFFPVEAEYEETLPLPIGRPVTNSFVYILDEYQQLQPPGVYGQLCVGGDGIARGYLNNPELTSERFIRIEVKVEVDKNNKVPGKNQGKNHRQSYNQAARQPGSQAAVQYHSPSPQYPITPIPHHPIYLTGDLARWLKDGNIKFLERIDYQVKIRGIRIELGEIENRLLNHDRVKAAVVIDRDDAAGNKYLCAYVVPMSRETGLTFVPALTQKEARDIVSKELKEYLSQSLPDYMIPSYIIPIHRVPLTSNGKLDREALPPPEIKKDITGKQERYVSIEPLEKKDYYVLSSAQKRLYILNSLDKEGISYNIPAVFELEGRIDKDKLENTFRRLVQFNESFRTSFEMVSIEPVQRIHDKVKFEIENYDVSEVKAEKQATEGKPATHLSSEFIRPFDLRRAPLLRVGLIKIRADNYILMVDMHHIVSDGTSMGILVKDFMALYAGRELPLSRIRYKDYSQWQTGDKQVQTIKKQEGYWMNRFEGEVPVLELPMDYTRTAVQSFEGASINFEITGARTAELKSLVLQKGATLYMLLLAIFNVLLSKLSGQEDIIIGTPTAGRTHDDLRQIIGMFVNTLALRHFPRGEKSFKTFLEEVKNNTLKAFENQDYHIEDLIEKVEVNRDTSRNPLFDVMFTLQNLEIPTLEIPGLTLKPHAYETGTSKFDITLTGFESGQKLVFTIQYNTKLFKEKTIQRFVNYFHNIVSAVLAAPGKKIEEIEIISREERERILIDFNDTAREYPGNKTIHELFEEQVEQTPDNKAVAGPLQIKYRTHMTYMTYLSYRELNERSNRLARVLIEKGVQPDTIVGIMVERSVEMIIGILGILKSGGAYLPIDPDYPEERIDYMLADSSAQFLLTGPGNQVSALKSSTSTFTSTSTCQVSPANMAYVIYTSGTTGKPKGVMIRHISIVNFVYSMYKDYTQDLSPLDNCLSLTNFCFDVSVCEIFMPLVFGAGIVLLPYDKLFEPKALARTIVKDSITFTYIPPGLLKDVYHHLRLYVPDHPPELNKMLVGVEPIQDDVLENYLSLNPLLQIINGYGPTEATICAAAYRYRSQQPEGKRVPIGVPIANTQILLLDKTNHLAPVGIPGELCISGIGLARGYLNRPGLTAEKFDRDEKQRVPGKGIHRSYKSYRSHMSYIYRTGDLAKWQPDGNILFIGRIDGQIKIRGFRIELGEIEKRLLRHSQIKEAVVVARELGKGNKQLLAYIVPQSAGTALSEGLREYLSGFLPGYMIPSYFVELEKLPLTPNGKVDQKLLPGPEAFKSLSGENYAAPATDMEKLIAGIWKDILKLKKIGIDDNFFDIGGNSLNILQVNKKLNMVLESPLPVMTMFRCTTIRSLAGFLSKPGTKGRLHRKQWSQELKKGKSDRLKRYQKREQRNRRENVKKRRRLNNGTRY